MEKELSKDNSKFEYICDLKLNQYDELYIPTKIDFNIKWKDIVDWDSCYNILICAKSWSGKSFFINNLLT